MKTGARFLAATAAAALATGTVIGAHSGAAHAEEEVSEPESFTSMFTTEGNPDSIVDEDGDSVPGEDGATSTFNLRINSDEEIVCYDITLDGVTPPYDSPAKTATHIHESPAGVQGPPRLSFPDPEEDEDGLLRSAGCIQGPFTTGLEDDDGVDTGEGFTLSEIEDDFEQFYADTHTEDYPMGAVRGQLTQVPVGGMDTGAGGSAQQAGGGATAAVVGALAAGAIGMGMAGLLLLRRRA